MLSTQSAVDAYALQVLPRKAYVPGLGLVRVLSYEDPDTFRVLTKQDHTYRIPRNRMEFRK